MSYELRDSLLVVGLVAVLCALALVFVPESVFAALADLWALP